jgi:hypothetical protein
VKTTIEIADPLMREARQLAERDGTTFRALVEDGLRRIISERAGKKKPSRFHFTTFKGQGLQPEFRDADWEKIRDAIYEGRGGDRG